MMVFRNSSCRTRIIALALVAAAGSGSMGSAEQPILPENADILIIEASRLLELDDLNAAQEKFTEATKIDPGATAAWIGLSEVEERKGDLLEALRFARRALATDPEGFAPHLLTGRVLAGLGEVPKALEELAKARQINPTNPEAYLISALLLRDSNRKEEAIEVLEDGRNLGLRSPVVESQLGFLLLSQGESVRALELAVAAISNYPDEGELYLVSGLALSKDLDRREEAISHLQKALALHAPRPGQVHLELAELLMEAKRYEETIASLEAARQLLPDLPQVEYRLGLARRAAGDAEGAKTALRRFQELKSQQDAESLRFQEIGTAQAQALAAQNRLPEALASIDELLVTYPQEPRALSLRAKVLFSMQKTEDALDSIRAARRLDSRRIENHYLESFILSRLGRLDEARIALERVLTLDSELAEAHALMGEIAYHQEDFNKSVNHLGLAIDLGLDNPTLRLRYAEGLQKLGRNEESQIQMRAYQQLQDG
jgi:tetratricopeptide (TPR) repeat protein